MKIQKFIRPERIVETLRQPCTKCETDLETYVLRKEKGLAATSFLIVKCNNCEELNLIADKPDIKELRYGNYTYVETLHTDDYSYEQALLRMEQIKVFRK
jgi:hypothetical protein